MMEDAVQAVFRRTLGRTSEPGLINFMSRIVGYVWVTAFTTWSSPIWMYPVIQDMRQEDAMLSFTALKAILVRR